MNIIYIINNLYTNKNSEWILELEIQDIQPYVIQRWLCMNDNARVHTRWLDKYVFSLPPRMYLSLAWSILPKITKAPFVKYIKKVDDTEEFDFILKKVRRQYGLSDNDYNSNKKYLLKSLKTNMKEWFKYYGIEKGLWNKYYLQFDYMKEGEVKGKSKGLADWGL